MSDDNNAGKKQGRSPWRYVLKHFVAIFIGVLLVITLVLLTIKEPVEREAPPTDEGKEKTILKVFAFLLRVPNSTSF